VQIMQSTGGRRARALLAALTAAAVVAALGVALAPAPTVAQDLPATPSDLIEQIGEVEGLQPLDPILNPVADLVIELENMAGVGEAGSVNTFRMDGDDAIEAAISFSRLTYQDGASTAILGRDDVFADGMASSGVQGVFDAPLLLTGSRDLDPRTGMELQRLGMTAVTILGGENALNPLVVSKLQAAGLQVTRIGGPTRIETTVQAAQATIPTASHALLIRAYPGPGQSDDQAYADLLAAGPFAAENGWPVLMTPSDSLHPATREQLDGFTRVTIVGGPTAIATGVEDELTASGIQVDRVFGENRFATAVAIAEARGFSSSADPDQIVLAEQAGRDDVWAPGFASSAYADRVDAPVLLSDGEDLPDETIEFLNAGVEQNLEDGGPAIICAPFVTEQACDSAGLLVTGNASAAADILGIDIVDLPLIGDVLDALLGAGLLPEELTDVIDELLGGGGDGGDSPLDPILDPITDALPDLPLPVDLLSVPTIPEVVEP
jgi:putative cell wall-binding protein